MLRRYPLNTLSRFSVGTFNPSIIFNSNLGISTAPIRVTRPGSSTTTLQTGAIQSAASDTLRYDFRGAGGLLSERGVTNYVQRSSHTAAFPWNTTSTHQGITATLVGTGFVGDVPYADYALTGTNTASVAEPFAPADKSRTIAASGQTWTASVFGRVVSGTWPTGRWISAGVHEETSANVYLAGNDSTTAPTTAENRFTITRTLSNASTARVRSAIVIGNLGAAGTTTFTGQVIRLYGWQLEQSPLATSLIQTLGGETVTRSQDAAAAQWLLVEGGATRLNGYLSIRSGTASAINATLTNRADNALGQFGGCSIASTGVASGRAVTNDISLTAGASYAIKILYSAGSSGQMRVTLRSNTGPTFTEITGAIGAITVITTHAGIATIRRDTDLGGGLRELLLIFTPNATGLHNIGLGPNSTTVGQTIIGYACQVEAGSTDTSYILGDTGAQQARSQDAIAPIDLTGIYSYGPELVSNGDFSNGLTGWAYDAGWSSSGGVASCTASGANRYLKQNVGIQNGKTYLITFNVTSKAGSISCPVFCGANAAAPTFPAAGQYRAVMTPTSASDALIWIGCGNGETVTIDNISVREITTPSLGVVFDGYLDGVAGDYDTIFRVDGGSDTGPRLVVYYDRVAARVLVDYRNAANVLQASFSFVVALPSRIRLAIRYSLNQLQVVCNGVASTVDTSVDFSAPQYARFGSTVAGLARPARMGVGQLLIGPAMSEAEALILGSLS